MNINRILGELNAERNRLEPSYRCNRRSEFNRTPDRSPTGFNQCTKETWPSGVECRRSQEAVAAAQAEVGFLAKPHMPKELFAKIAELLHAAPLRPALPKDRSPVWVPRNGKYYVITCTDCLRSFSIPAEENDRFVRDLRTLECIFCKALVKFIVEEKFRLIPGRTGTPAPRNTQSIRS